MEISDDLRATQTLRVRRTEEVGSSEQQTATIFRNGSTPSAQFGVEARLFA